MQAPNPAHIFETLNAYQASAALHGAIELGLFTAIGRSGATAAELAGRCGADPRGVRILCDYLVAREFLAKAPEDSPRYTLTPLAAQFLDQASPAYLGSIARFVRSPDLQRAFEDVAGLVRRGGTQLHAGGTTADEYHGWVEFARSMAPLMAPAAEFLAGLAAERLPDARRVLDVAAGHGLFGIELARRLPAATIAALDWPQVLEVARENAHHAGIAERFELLAGDALRRELGSGYDVVLVTNFFHHFDRETCVGLMRRIKESLADSGIVLTLEFVPDPDRVSPPVPATFALTMLASTPAGDAYTFAEYDSMWQEAGLDRSEWLDVPRTAQRVLITRAASRGVADDRVP